MIIDGEKWACNACVRGHRVSSCSHRDRPLNHVNKKGRPVSQCQHCRRMRKSRTSHVKCECGSTQLHLPFDSGRTFPRTPSGRKTKGSRTQSKCACATTKKCTCSAKREAARSQSLSPGPATPASMDGLSIITPLQPHLVDDETSSRHVSPESTHDLTDVSEAPILSAIASKATHCHAMSSQGPQGPCNDKYEQYLANQPKVGFGGFECGSTHSVGNTDGQSQLHEWQWGAGTLSVSARSVLSSISSNRVAQSDPTTVLLSPASLSHDGAEFGHDHMVSLTPSPPGLNNFLREQSSSTAMLNGGRASDASCGFQAHHYTQPSQRSSENSPPPAGRAASGFPLSSFPSEGHSETSQLSKPLDWTSLDGFQFNVDPNYSNMAVPLGDGASAPLAAPTSSLSSCASQVASSSINIPPFTGMSSNITCHPQAPETFYMPVPVATSTYLPASSGLGARAVASSPNGAANLHVGQAPAWNLGMGGEQVHTSVPIDGHINLEQWY